MSPFSSPLEPDDLGGGSAGKQDSLGTACPDSVAQEPASLPS